MKLKRKSILFALIGITIGIFIVFASFYAKNTREKNEVYDMSTIKQDSDNVELIVLKDTIEATNMVVELKNNTSYNLGYGLDYRIEKRSDKGWTNIEANSNSSTMAVGYTLSARKSVQKKIDWSNKYGALEKGNYRIIKKIHLEQDNNGYTRELEISAEFSI